MLRVANVRNEATIETVRDALDELGVDYEHIRSEPGDDVYPQTAYFYVPDDSADDVDAVMQRLSEDLGFEAEVL
jgi:signal recognition particle subunit SEC65